MNSRFNLRSAERKLIVDALQTTFYHQAKAAQLLGVSARVLNYKMQLHGIPRAIVDAVVPRDIVKQRAKEGRAARRAKDHRRRMCRQLALVRNTQSILDSLGA